MKTWTVVGMNDRDDFPTTYDRTWVEVVEAESPDDAEFEAIEARVKMAGVQEDEQESEREREAHQIISIFEGEHQDVYQNF